MKKTIIFVLIITSLLQFCGCYSQKYITQTQFLSNENNNYEVYSYDGNIYKLVKDQYKVEYDTIYFINGPIYFNPYKISKIALSDVFTFSKAEFDTGKTFLGLGVTLIVAAIIGGIIIGAALGDIY